MNAIVMLAWIASTIGAPQYQEELVFPPEAFHNHSASIVETANGDLLVAWFHGKGEKGDDTLVILGSRKRRGEAPWSAPFLMADNQDLPDQNPVLYIGPRGTLWLWWISSLDNDRQTYLLKYRTSNDYLGDAPPKWSWNDVIHCRPRNLPSVIEDIAGKVNERFGDTFDSDTKYRERLELAQELVNEKLWRRLGWMPRCQPIMLSENRMMLGLYSDIFCTSMAAFTEDGGRTWAFGEPMRDYGLIQPGFLRREDGTIVAYGRDKGPSRHIRTTESNDGGLTWGPVRDLFIRNPESSVSATALKNGHWVLVCNDLDGRSRHGRSKLSVYLSEDEGATWPIHRAFEDNPDNEKACYPTVIQTADGLIHCAYTYTPDPNETIKHAWFNEEWIRAQPESSAGAQ